MEYGRGLKDFAIVLGVLGVVVGVMIIAIVISLF
jgi:hypothetical protein